jgi:hypothetical protein
MFQGWIGMVAYVAGEVEVCTGVHMTTGDDRSASVAELLHEAGETHHRVYRIVDGEDLAHRIREQLADEDGVTEKAMFGGLAFMLHGNIAVGISNGGELMVRVGPKAFTEALARPHTRIFDMTSRPMKGWILLAEEGFATKRQLGAWVRRGVAFARTLPPKG